MRFEESAVAPELVVELYMTRDLETGLTTVKDHIFSVPVLVPVGALAMVFPPILSASVSVVEERACYNLCLMPWRMAIRSFWVLAKFVDLIFHCFIM